MKRRIREITHVLAVSVAILSLSASCSEADDELMDNMEIQAELATDEEDEKKSKPGQAN